MDQASSTDGGEVRVAPGHNLTLGEMIDGFFHLKQADKDLFLSVIGQGGKSVQPVRAGGPTAPSASADAVPAGCTRDPKTGKVFKIIPKKDKTQARIELEQILEKSKKDLYETSKRLSLPLTGKDRRPTRAPTPQETEVIKPFHMAYKAALSALEAYKASHPGEFKAPKGSRQMEPQTGSTSPFGSPKVEKTLSSLGPSGPQKAVPSQKTLSSKAKTPA